MRISIKMFFIRRTDHRIVFLSRIISNGMKQFATRTTACYWRWWQVKGKFWFEHTINSTDIHTHIHTHRQIEWVVQVHFNFVLEPQPNKRINKWRAIISYSITMRVNVFCCCAFFFHSIFLSLSPSLCLSSVCLSLCIILVDVNLALFVSNMQVQLALILSETLLAFIWTAKW